MFRHPVTGIGGLLVAYAFFAFIYFSTADAAERDFQYFGAYISLGTGAFLILIGLILQGFRRLERLIIFRSMGAVEADGILGSIWDSPTVRDAHLKGEAKKIS